MISKPDPSIVDANSAECHGAAGRSSTNSAAKRLKTALARSCCRDGRVNQSSLRPNITTRRRNGVMPSGRFVNRRPSVGRRLTANGIQRPYNGVGLTDHACGHYPSVWASNLITPSRVPA
jgi:hypothetical protein